MRDSAFQSNDADEPLPTSRDFSDWQRIEALNDAIGELEAELAGVKEDRDALEIEVRSTRTKIDAETFDVMRRVREWFHDRILKKRDVPKQLCRDLDDIVLGRVM